MLFAMLLSVLHRMYSRGSTRLRDDRGDVPGWVMVTVMTAILVVGILAVFRPQITDALSGIIKSISDSK